MNDKNSYAIGHDNQIDAKASYVLGKSNQILGANSQVIGRDNTVSGKESMSIGQGLQVPSSGEVVVGFYNETYTPLGGSNNYNAADRLFSIGRGKSSSDRSNALTILKNGNTGIGTTTPDHTLHLVGSLKYEDGFQSPGYVLTSDSSGMATWQALPSGFVDTDDQTLSLNGDTLSIENGNSVVLLQSLSPFAYSGDLVLPDTNTVNQVVADFVFGSTQLNNDGIAGHHQRLFFDKSKGALRSGVVYGTEWDESHIGLYSVAFGIGTEASGSVSTAMGSNTTASGFYSTVMGSGNTAPSFAETVLGLNSTLYTSNSQNSWNAFDRLFTIGNGTNVNNRSDALVILKNGNTGLGTSTPDTTLHLVGKLKYQDGTEGIGYVLTSDSSGVASWQPASSGGSDTLSIISDADGDTKIQVEKNTDEDVIRFQTGFIERMILNSSGLTLNSGLQDVQLIFNNGTSNSIISKFPGISSPPPGPEKHIMDFEVFGNTTLSLQGDGGVRINDTYTLPTTDGDSAQVLTTDGSGNVSWQSTPGIIKVTKNIDLPILGGGSGLSHTETVTVAGAQPGATVHVSPASHLVGIFTIGYAYVSAPDTVMIVFHNHNSVGNDNPPKDFYITVIN